MEIAYIENEKTNKWSEESTNHKQAVRYIHIIKQLSGNIKSKPSSNKEQSQLRKCKKTINDKRALKGEALFIKLGCYGNEGM
jgi:hypothetical protein